jgi:hypothetical protein
LDELVNEDPTMSFLDDENLDYVKPSDDDADETKSLIDDTNFAQNDDHPTESLTVEIPPVQTDSPLATSSNTGMDAPETPIGGLHCEIPTVHTLTLQTDVPPPDLLNTGVEGAPLGIENVLKMANEPVDANASSDEPLIPETDTNRPPTPDTDLPLPNPPLPNPPLPNLPLPLNHIPNYKTYSEDEWNFPAKEHRGPKVNPPPNQPPATIIPFVQNTLNPFVRHQPPAILPKPVHPDTKSDYNFQGAKVVAAWFFLTREPLAKLRWYVTYRLWYDAVVKRFEHVAISLGQIAVEARDTGKDILIEFRAMTGPRTVMLNELVSVWGTSVYTEAALEAGKKRVGSWAIFGRGGLDYGSPTQAEITAAVGRACGWIFFYTDYDT